MGELFSPQPGLKVDRKRKQMGQRQASHLRLRVSVKKPNFQPQDKDWEHKDTASKNTLMATGYPRSRVNQPRRPGQEKGHRAKGRDDGQGNKASF